jgi:hypothetical protein
VEAFGQSEKPISKATLAETPVKRHEMAPAQIKLRLVDGGAGSNYARKLPVDNVAAR